MTQAIKLAIDEWQKCEDALSPAAVTRAVFSAIWATGVQSLPFGAFPQRNTGDDALLPSGALNSIKTGTIPFKSSTTMGHGDSSEEAALGSKYSLKVYHHSGGRD